MKRERPPPASALIVADDVCFQEAAKLTQRQTLGAKQTSGGGAANVVLGWNAAVRLVDGNEQGADNPLSDAFSCSERERPFRAAKGATELPRLRTLPMSIPAATRGIYLNVGEVERP